MADIATNIDQSGNDILAYRGDAALAGGYQGQGTPEGLGADSLNTFNRSLENLFKQNNEWNVRQYVQKVKDRDDVMEAVASNVIDIDVLDEDRKPLEDQINKIQAIRLKTPDIMSDAKAWNELQTEIKKFTDMKNTAKVRSVEIRKMAKEMAANPDERFRKQYQNYIQGEIGKGLTHIPNPYLMPQDWDAGLFGGVPTQARGKVGQPGIIQQNSVFQVKDLPGSNKPVIQDGLYYKEKITGTDLKDWEQFYSPANFVEGENKNLPDQAYKFYQFAMQDPNLMSDENINAINSKLDAINKANNLTPDNPRFLSPIAERNPDGRGWNVVDNPLDFVKKISLFKDYRLPTRQLQIDEDAQKAASTRAQENLRYAQARTEGSKQALNAAKARAASSLSGLYDAKAAKEKATEVSAAAEESVRTFKELGSKTAFQPVSSLRGNIPAPVWNGIKNNLGVDDNAQVAEIPRTNMSAVRMLSAPAFNEDGKKVGVNKPRRIFAVKKPDGTTQLIGIGPDGGVQKVVDKYTGAAEIIKHDQNYNQNAQTVKLYDVATQVVGDLDGDEDIEETTTDTTVASPTGGIAQRISSGSYDEAIREGNETYYRIGESFYDANGNEVTE